MKHMLISIAIFLFLPLSVFAAGEQVVDIDIEGMSCKFCAYGIQKNLSKLPYVEKAEVNIETKKAHIVIVSGKQANIDQLKKQISDSGFTPVKVTIGSNK